MPPDHTFVTNLLAAYHGGADRDEEPLSIPTIDQLRYLNDIGLGPIAFRVYGDYFRGEDPETYGFLLSAELTTRALYKQMENATVELLDGLNSAGLTPALLKGISTAYEYYSPHHLRLMGDVDILIDEDEVPATLAKLGDLGYRISDRDWRRYREKGHHHLPGARNPKSGTTVEVHTALIPPDEPLSGAAIFQRNSIDSQLVRFSYGGVPAARFTPEFQLVYTVAHWGLDGNWASNITSINDVIHILRSHERDLHWPEVVGWVSESPWLHANLAALVKYLVKSELVTITPEKQRALAPATGHMQGKSERILLWLLHNYPFNAQEKKSNWQEEWRAHEFWRELTGSSGRDIVIPYAVLRTALRSIHHGKYNPIALLLALYRRSVARL